MPTFELRLLSSLVVGSREPLMWLACLMSGAATGMGIHWLLSTLRAEDVEQDDEWRYDVTRIQTLRQSDRLYQLFQGVIQGLAKLNRAALSGRLPEIQRQSERRGCPGSGWRKNTWDACS